MKRDTLTDVERCVLKGYERGDAMDTAALPAVWATVERLAGLLLERGTLDTVEEIQADCAGIRDMWLRLPKWKRRFGLTKAEAGKWIAEEWTRLPLGRTSGGSSGAVPPYTAGLGHAVGARDAGGDTRRATPDERRRELEQYDYPALGSKRRRASRGVGASWTV